MRHSHAKRRDALTRTARHRPHPHRTRHSIHNLASERRSGEGNRGRRQEGRRQASLDDGLRRFGGADAGGRGLRLRGRRAVRRREEVRAGDESVSSPEILLVTFTCNIY